MWLIALIDFYILNDPFIPRMQLAYCGGSFDVFLNLICKYFHGGFLHLCSSGTLAYDSLPFLGGGVGSFSGLTASVMLLS